MRIVSWLLAAISLLSSGCAHRIAGMGLDLNSLNTRDQVHAKLGTPSLILTDEHGITHEKFHTRRKIAEPYPFRCFGPGYAIGLYLTLGTLELYCVSYEVCLAAKNTLLGQTVHVSYDAGRVTSIYVEGVEPGVLDRSRARSIDTRTADTALDDPLPQRP